MNSDQRSKAKKEAGHPPAWLFKVLTKSHVFLNRISGGKHFNTIKGDEVCFVTMTGAKSGKRITIPLMYVPYEDGVLLVASKGGAPRNPVWYNNIVKNPELKVRHRGKTISVSAQLATIDEKNTLWPICDAHYAEYADYRNQTEREIPIFVCKPKQKSDAI